MKNTSSGLFPQSELFFYTPSTESQQTFLYPLCFGHYYCNKNYLVHRTSFDSFLLMVIIRGSAFITSYGETECTIHLHENQIYLLDCYQPHTYGSLTDDLEFYWIHFDGSLCRNYYSYYKKNCPKPFSLSSKQLQTVLHDFSSIYLPLSSGNVIPEIILSHRLISLLTKCIYFQQMPNSSSYTDHSVPEDIEQIIAYMRIHFSEPLNIDFLAQMAHLSTYQFIRRFRHYCHLTPHQYLLNIRLNSARFYLRTTRKTIKEIAYICGFQSENNFCIAFKRQEQMSPGTYRNQIPSDS